MKHRNLFWDSNFPKSYLLPIRVYSLHKNEIKMIRRVHYSSNTLQDSTKIKSTKNKTLGYLPSVLFFNAFELGVESKTQVFSNEEALRSIPEVLSTRNCILSKQVLEDPFSTLLGSLLSSKGFSGTIQSKFFSKASCIPTSLKGIGILISSLFVLITSTHEPRILKCSKTYLASITTYLNSLCKVSRIKSLFSQSLIS
jgi:hypothetical protein